MMPTSATTPTAPAMIAPVLMPFSVGATTTGPPPGPGGGGVGPGPGGVGPGPPPGGVGPGPPPGVGPGPPPGGVGPGPPPQFLCPGGAHQLGRGTQAGGAAGPRLARAAVAEVVPHLQSAETPRAVCAAPTMSAFAGSHGLMPTIACNAGGTPRGGVGVGGGGGVGKGGSVGGGVGKGGGGVGIGAAPHPGGTDCPPSALESAAATEGSYLPVPMGTGLLGFAEFHAALKL